MEGADVVQTARLKQLNHVDVTNMQTTSPSSSCSEAGDCFVRETADRSIVSLETSADQLSRTGEKRDFKISGSTHGNAGTGVLLRLNVPDASMSPTYAGCRGKTLRQPSLVVYSSLPKDANWRPDYRR